MASKTSLDIVPGAPWVLIAVMGLTGTGKSTFIQTASESPEVIIGHDLESCIEVGRARWRSDIADKTAGVFSARRGSSKYPCCCGVASGAGMRVALFPHYSTSEMRGYTFHYKGRNVNLIDTPGFDDTHKTETEVLTSIAEWLQESYKKKQKLHGVIYLHNINKPRMEGSALRNLRMFRELCGESPLKNVILATSFWGEVTQGTGESREAELRERPEFWGQMVDHGSRMMRFTDRASALKILEYFMPMLPVPLEIQREMIDQSKQLKDTAAGKHMNEELRRREEVHRKELQNIKEEHERAIEEKDEQLRVILEENQRRIENNLEKIYRQQEQLRAERRAEDRKRQNDFENQLQRMETMSRVSIDRESTSDIRDMSFDELVAKIRANEIKITSQDRDKVEAMIAEAQKSSGLSTPAARKKKGTSRYLLPALRILTPLITGALIGVPIMWPSFGQDSGATST